MSPLPASAPSRPIPAKPLQLALRRLASLALDTLAFSLTAVAVTGFVISLGRREIARDLILLYFQEHGIEAHIDIDQVNVAGLSGSLRLGPASHPDLEIEKFEIAFARGAASGSSSPGKLIDSVLLVRPRIGLILRNGQLDFASLDPLIKILSQPSDRVQGPITQPDIQVVGALVSLQTENGPLRIRLSAALKGSRLLSLEGQVQPFSFTGDGLLLAGSGGPVRARTGEGAITLVASLAIAELVNDNLGLEDAKLGLEASLPYPALDGRRDDQRLQVRAGLKSSAISRGAWVAQDAEVNLRFDGQLQTLGQIRQLRGDISVLGRMAALASDGVEGRGGRFALQGKDLSLSLAADRGLAGRLSGGLGLDQLGLGTSYLEAPHIEVVLSNLAIHQARGEARATADADLTLSADRLVRGGLGLDHLTVHALVPRLAYSSANDGEWPRTVLTGSLSAQTARLETAGKDGPVPFSLADLSAEFSGAVQWRSNGPDLALMVSAKARDDMDLASAQALLGPLAVKAGAPFSEQSKALEAALSDFQIQVPKASLSLQSQGVRISLVRPVQVLTASGARFDLSAQPASPAWAQDLDGNLDLRGDLAARLGESGQDLQASLNAQVHAQPDGTYQIGGHLDLSRLDLAGQKLGLRSAQGEIDLSGDAKGLVTSELVLSTGQLVDLDDERRFEPLSLKGQARFEQGSWRAKVSAATSTGQALAKLSLRHTPMTGLGEAVIEAKDLVFTNPGLQPRDITPLLRSLSKASGRADFSGRFDWTRAASTSSGVLRVQGLNAQTPMGAVSQGHMDVKFTSLEPLATGPGQTLGAQRLGFSPPLTALNGLFSVAPDALILQVGAADWAGGRVWLEPSRLPLDPSRAVTGSLVLDGVDLGQILAASPLADQVKITAIVDGTLPFALKNGAIQISGGQLAARGAGRLSIARTALSGLQTGSATGSGAVTAGPTAPLGGNAIQDFAYQAMENLAFDSLDARIDSLPGARLGLVFHIKGRNDPEKDVPSKIALRDLVAGRAFDKPIALPKGTPIDLTLDTSLNFGDLIKAAQQAFERRAKDEASPTHRSVPVQP
jgi:hypothetical protein